MTTLEHVSITVINIDAACRFLSIIAPDFKIRHRGKTSLCEWAFIGNQSHYFTLQAPFQRPGIAPSRHPYQQLGVNYIGLVVDDLPAIITRLNQLGYQHNDAQNKDAFRQRVRFMDDTGFEWELIASSNRYISSLGNRTASVLPADSALLRANYLQSNQPAQPPVAQPRAQAVSGYILHAEE